MSTNTRFHPCVQQVGALGTRVCPPPHADVRRESPVGRAAQVGGEAIGKSFLATAGEGCVPSVFVCTYLRTFVILLFLLARDDVVEGQYTAAKA